MIANEKDASGRYTGYVDKPFFLREDNILKHSPNIIDLIECGDYVNGHLVIAVDREKLEVSIENCMYGSDYEDINGNIDIKSVVTKEQFEAIKYVIGE